MRILSFNTIDSFARNHLEAATMVEWVEDALTHKQELSFPRKLRLIWMSVCWAVPARGFTM